MLKSLRQVNLYPTARIDRAFKIKAGETARGIRLVVKDMDLKDLKFKNYIKIENKLFENEAIEIDSKNRFVDIYFPSLDPGTYQSELLIYDDDKLLKSGTYIIDVEESIIVGEADKLKEINGDKLLIFIENFKVSATDILKKLDTVEKRYNDILQDISEKVKGMTELANKETPQGAQEKANTALQQAKEYAKSEITKVVGGASEAYDTLKEIEDELKKNDSLDKTINQALKNKTGKFSQDVGNAVDTSIVVKHNLKTQDLVVTLREKASPFRVVYTDVEITDENTVTLKFAKAPALNEYRVIVIG